MSTLNFTSLSPLEQQALGAILSSSRKPTGVHGKPRDNGFLFLEGFRYTLQRAAGNPISQFGFGTLKRLSRAKKNGIVREGLPGIIEQTIDTDRRIDLYLKELGLYDALKDRGLRYLESGTQKAGLSLPYVLRMSHFHRRYSKCGL
jgi:hypothetical protein